MDTEVRVDDRWYKNGLIYELSVRTFADGNGDGIGDFRGLSKRLDYLAALGVTTVWLSPFYDSPWRDDGYDITDFYGVHPDFGDLGDFVRFVEHADDRGIRVLVDLVLNHTSDQHPWFQAARAATRASATSTCGRTSGRPTRRRGSCSPACRRPRGATTARRAATTSTASTTSSPTSTSRTPRCARRWRR